VLEFDAFDVGFAVAAVGVTVAEVGVVASGRVTTLLNAEGRSSGKVRVLCRIRSIAVWFSRSRDRSAELALTTLVNLNAVLWQTL
jgi:hypothetical protein